MLNKFSEELKEARIKNELTLQQIAAKTRIDIKFLENLENGNFVFLPELYIKAFIREYAKLVELDENITLKKFDAAKRGRAYDELGNSEDELKKLREKEEAKPLKTQAETPVMHPTFEAYDSSNRPPETSSKSVNQSKLLIGIAVTVVVLVGIIYFAFIKGSSDIIVSEKPYEQVQKENEQRFVTDAVKPAASDSSYAVGTDSLSLVLDSRDTSWIKILEDGSKTVEFTLFPHSHREVRALKNYKLTIGNAGGIQLKLNNRPLNFSGTRHEVKYITVDSTGLQYLTSSPNL